MLFGRQATTRPGLTPFQRSLFSLGRPVLHSANLAEIQQTGAAKTEKVRALHVLRELESALFRGRKIRASFSVGRPRSPPWRSYLVVRRTRPNPLAPLLPSALPRLLGADPRLLGANPHFISRSPQFESGKTRLKSPRARRLSRFPREDHDEPRDGRRLPRAGRPNLLQSIEKEVGGDTRKVGFHLSRTRVRPLRMMGPTRAESGSGRLPPGCHLEFSRVRAGTGTSRPRKTPVNSSNCPVSTKESIIFRNALRAHPS